MPHSAHHHLTETQLPHWGVHQTAISAVAGQGGTELTLPLAPHALADTACCHVVLEIHKILGVFTCTRAPWLAFTHSPRAPNPGLEPATDY